VRGEGEREEEREREKEREKRKKKVKKENEEEGMVLKILNSRKLLLTPWCRVLLEKLTGLQPHFMEPEGSLPHSQASTTCPQIVARGSIMPVSVS
jgi:hypothetical protein